MAREIISTTKAPAALGPYSQAVKVGDTVYISGQIPLVPETMEVAEGEFEDHARLVFNHLKSIAEEAGGSMNDFTKVNKNIPPAIAVKIRQVTPVVEASFKRALKGNVKIAFGTDSGVSKHGTNAREFQLMVKYGMDENAAIKSATITASEVLGMSSKIGTIEKGKIADIISVGANPLEDISSLNNVLFVMKEGKIYKD